MKKWTLCLMFLVVLSGCSAESKELERGLELRTRLLKSSGFSFDADITADYGDKLHAFSMHCQTDTEGNVTFTVTAPETIAGITGRITQAGGALTFDDTALQFDLLADEQLSPVSGPWILVKTLLGGYLTDCVQEGELLHLQIDDSYEDDALHLDIWLDAGNLPVQAEIYYDNRRIVTMTVSNFTIL